MLALPSQNYNCHGHHGHGGAIFKTKSRKMIKENSLRRQFFFLLAMTVLLRLVPRDCWLVLCWANMSLAMVGGLAQPFYFCCSISDASTKQGSENSRTYLVLINIYIKNLYVRLSV